jgi:hypothetical protein
MRQAGYLAAAGIYALKTIFLDFLKITRAKEIGAVLTITMGCFK